jgi:hypothetical protein
MGPIVLFVTQLAFFCFGVLHLARTFFQWSLHPRERIVRMSDRFWADPSASIQREAFHTCTLALAAYAAWLWADLSWLWLGIAIVLGVSGLSSFWYSRRLHADPALAKRRRVLSDADIDRLAARGRRIAATASGLALVLWFYSWWAPLRQSLQSLSTGSAL